MHLVVPCRGIIIPLDQRRSSPPSPLPSTSKSLSEMEDGWFCFVWAAEKKGKEKAQRDRVGLTVHFSSGGPGLTTRRDKSSLLTRQLSSAGT